jgi:hypothetical protein
MTSTKLFQGLLKKLHQIDQERSRLQKLFSKDGILIAGSYGETAIPCGKPTCHCHRDGGHFATRLMRWVNGKLKTQVVRIDDREWVGLASASYKAHKATLKDVQNLHKRELDLLSRIIKLKTIDYG